MTVQIADKLKYKGKLVSMWTYPLSAYFDQGGTNPGFESNCSTLWRGYVGTWEIVKAGLYLVNLKGTLADGSSVTLRTVFPGVKDRVFADWYTGTIIIPQGKQLDYSRTNMLKIHERDLFLEFNLGMVSGKRVRHNVIHGNKSSTTELSDMNKKITLQK